MPIKNVVLERIIKSSYNTFALGNYLSKNIIRVIIKNWQTIIPYQLDLLPDDWTLTIAEVDDIKSEVNIYIPEDPSLNEKESIVNACGEFMEALGFELEAEDEPIYNSFWKRIKFVLNKQTSMEDLDRLAKIGKQALQIKLVDFPTAQQTEKLAQLLKNYK